MAKKKAATHQPKLTIKVRTIKVMTVTAESSPEGAQAAFLELAKQGYRMVGTDWSRNDGTFDSIGHQRAKA